MDEVIAAEVDTVKKVRQRDDMTKAWNAAVDEIAEGMTDEDIEALMAEMEAESDEGPDTPGLGPLKKSPDDLLDPIEPET